MQGQREKTAFRSPGQEGFIDITQVLFEDMAEIPHGLVGMEAEGEGQPSAAAEMAARLDELFNSRASVSAALEPEEAPDMIRALTNRMQSLLAELGYCLSELRNLHEQQDRRDDS